MFKEIPNRDAWNVIRGFVFQVDVTILRWLKLETHQTLELEKGEDIDIITSSINTKELRELEQIKHRDKLLTLNSDSVLDAIFNLYQHQQNNPNQSLVLRFVTNSKFTVERPALFKNGTPGILAWSSYLTENVIMGDYVSDVLQKHLKKKFSEAYKDIIAKDIHKTTQESQFILFLENGSREVFEKFMLSFEWAMANEVDENIASNIRDVLLEKRASDNVDVDKVYEKLFLFVFKLLCQPGEKVLTSKHLIEQISSPIHNIDIELLASLKFILHTIEPRLAKLEQVQSNFEPLLQNLQRLIGRENLEIAFQYDEQTLPVELPSAVINGSEREEKIQKLLNMFQERVWISLVGINGTGKTQLALLLSKKFIQVIWIDLSQYSNDEKKALITIERVLTKTYDKPLKTNRKNWIEDIVNLMPDYILLVLNDLPRISKDSELCSLLTQLTNGFKGSNRKILTTSNFSIQNIISLFIEEELFSEDKDLNFSDIEIVECLINRGAPQSIFQNVNLIIAVSQRNPRMLISIIHYLKGINWGLENEELLSVILSRQFAQEVLDNTQLQINNSIEDESVRELLYRLSIVNWKFDTHLAKAIAGVSTEIQFVNEKLSYLLDTWLQRIGHSHYQISPLIYELGLQNLNNTTITSIYHAAANALVETGKLDYSNAHTAITFFLKSNDYNAAGQILLTALKSARNEEEIKYLKDWGYTLLWSTQPLPSEMNMLLCAFIRIEHIRIFHSLRSDSTFYIRDLVELSNRKTNSALEQFGVNLFLTTQSYDLELDVFFKAFEKIIDTFQKLINEQLPLDIRPGDIIKVLWIPVQKIANNFDLIRWLNAIDKAESILGEPFFANEVIDAAIAVLCSNLVASFHANRDGEKNIESLETLYKYLEARNEEILSTIVMKEIIYFDYKESTDKVDVINTSQKIINNSQKKQSKYLIYDVVGRLLFNDDQKEESSTWLLQAVATNCTYENGYIDTLVYTASAISKKDSHHSILLCQQAISLAESNKFFAELDYLMLHGELAIAYWINGDMLNAF